MKIFDFKKKKADKLLAEARQLHDEGKDDEAMGAMRVRVEFITAFLSCVLEICFISSPREKKWMWVRHVGVIEKPSLRGNK